MAITQKLVTVYSCERCEHDWIPRDWDQAAKDQSPPLVCPKCKSPYWNRPRQASEEPKPAPKKAAKKRAKK